MNTKKPKILTLKTKIFRELEKIKHFDNIQILKKSPFGYFMSISFIFNDRKIDSYRLFYVQRKVIDSISFSYSDNGKTLTPKDINNLAKALNL